MTRPGDEVTIRVHLPQPLSKVAQLLALCGELWPDVPVDTTEGWLVDVPADDA